ncbi:MAG: rod-binding protein [Sulfurospirillaceae bacterium]|nr:rod-binding protein [Sulfurospirillaceae bacterium]
MMVDNSTAIMNASYGNYSNLNLEDKNDILLKEQTDKFEAFFVKQVLDIAMKNDSKLFPQDAGDKIYRSMYNDTMSDSLSGQFGLSELLFEFLKQKG